MLKNDLVCIVQARLTSGRYPNKILKKILGYSLIDIINKRLKKSKSINKIIFAIPDNKRNVKLKNILKRKKIKYITGSEKNVFQRFYKIIKKTNPKYVVRVTSDCPLVEPYIIDKMYKILRKSNIDYISTDLASYPDGFDVEIFKSKCILNSINFNLNKYQLEHVTPFLRKNKNFKKKKFSSKYKNFYKIKLSIDTKTDFKRVKKIFDYFQNIFINEDHVFKYISTNK